MNVPPEIILSDPLFKRVDMTGECWIWMGSKTPLGYGKIRRHKKMAYVHRIVAEAVYGPIPDRMYVCHHCDTPPCVRPEHLFIGTAADNARDRNAKGRGVWPHRLGSENAHAVLTEPLVMEMRQLSRDGVSTADIARRFGQNEHTIRQAIVGTNWSHLPGAVPLAPGAQHVLWIKSQAPHMAERLANGESLRSIGRSLGIAADTVSRAVKSLREVAS